MLTNSFAEEEKKIVAGLFGKLYVSPASTEEKIRTLYADVSEAVDNQLVADTTGRNALYKIHVSLGKIVNNLDQAAAQHEGFGRRSVSSRATSVALEERTVVEDKTVVHEADIKEEEEGDGEEQQEEDGEGDSNEGTVIQKGDEDSLVEDLLSEEET